MMGGMQPHEALAPLVPLVGTWTAEAVFPPGGPTGVTGRTEFSWILDGAFLLQRAVVAHPQAPDVHAVIAAAGDGTFLQHYFDARGVVRQYAMTFADGRWTLARDPPAPDFAQRFHGRLSPDGATLTGAWDARRDGIWQHDFDLTYRRNA